MKRITITESQYKRLLLSEQVKNPSYYCIKKDYSTKGKEVKLPNGVSFKILSKNGDALYFVEDGTFYHIKDGKGWKKSGKYDCGANEYSVGKSKGKLYDYINNFLSQKSTTSGTKSSGSKGGSTENIQYCVAEGKRLAFIRDIFSSEDFEVKMGRSGCIIQTKPKMNQNGVEYTLTFQEDPNFYQLELKDKSTKNPGIDVPKLRELFADKPKALGRLDVKSKPYNILINGEYSLEKPKIKEQTTPTNTNTQTIKNKVNQAKDKISTTLIKPQKLGAYYLTIDEINGEDFDATIKNKIIDLVSVLNLIVKTAKLSRPLTDEEKKKLTPAIYYAEKLNETKNKNDYKEFYRIIVEEVKGNCDLLEDIKTKYEGITKNNLRTDWNGSSFGKGSPKVMNAMSDYLNAGGCASGQYTTLGEIYKSIKK